MSADYGMPAWSTLSGTWQSPHIYPFSMAADGPALLAAVVRAAVVAKASRRTVQAVAAAVTGVLASQKSSVPRECALTLAHQQCELTSVHLNSSQHSFGQL